MTHSIYLINPRADGPDYFGVGAFVENGWAPATLVADLATVTVAALVPTDFEVEICDVASYGMRLRSNGWRGQPGQRRVPMVGGRVHVADLHVAEQR